MEFLSLFDHKENLQFFGQHSEFPSLSDTISTLICAERTARKYKKVDDPTLQKDSPKRTSSHQRMFSEPAIYNNLRELDIDDPVESEEDYGDGWYFGRTSPPPSIITNTTPTVIPDSILNHDIHVPNKPISPSRHRRNYSAGNIDSPPRVNGKSIYPSRSAKDSSLFRLIVTLQLCLVRRQKSFFQRPA